MAMQYSDYGVPMEDQSDNGNVAHPTTWLKSPKPPKTPQTAPPPPTPPEPPNPGQMTAPPVYQTATAAPAPASPVTPTGQIAPPPSGQPVAQEALQRAINTPTLSADVINQQKGALKDQAALMNQQGREQVAQNAAARGLEGGGWQQAQNRQLNSATTSSLLGGYRDLDIAAADLNRKNMLAALGIDAQNFATSEGAAASRFGASTAAAASMYGANLGYEANKNNVGLGYAQLNSSAMQALWNAIFGR